jgi:hypothetical protein
MSSNADYERMLKEAMKKADPEVKIFLTERKVSTLAVILIIQSV